MVSCFRSSTRTGPALLLLLGAFVVGSLLPPSAPAQQAELVDRVAAVVGDDIVLKSEVDQMVARRTRQGNRSYSDELWMNSLQELIDQKVLAEKARRDTTIVVSDQQVNNQLDRQIEQMIERAGSEERLEEAYGRSVREIKETFRSDFRDQLLAQRLRQRRMQDLDITPSEVKQWFESLPSDSIPKIPETVRLSHIVRFPKPSETARSDAREIITSIRDSIVNAGASFEEMARQFSDHPTASSGGKLSGVNINDLVPEFSAVVSQTPIGEVSQVFYNEQQNGYHILRVNSKSGNTVDMNHILIEVQGSDSDAAKAYLRTVRDSILNYDVTFEEMARRHSEEERSAQNGGQVTDPQTGIKDLPLEALNATWKRTIRSLDTGEISEPTRVTLIGSQEEAFHIVRLERQIPAHRANLDMDYERIRQRALEAKRQREMQKWLEQLREEVYVDVRITEQELTAMRNRL